MVGVRFHQLVKTLLSSSLILALVFSASRLANAEIGALPSSIKAQPTIAAGPPEEPVLDIKIVGNRNIPTPKVMHEVHTRVGRAFDQSIFETDVRKLALKGWFVDVKPQVDHVQGGVIVTFQVIERPTLQYVKYVGNKKMNSKTLAKKSELKRGGAMDPYAVEEGRRKMEEYYREKGYNNIQITILEGSKATDKGATFLINEGVAQKVWTVKFVGNTIVGGGRLKTQIQSKPPILYLFKGYVEKKKIDEDVERLTAYYRSLGYFRARIGRELEFDEDGDWMTLTFVIDEGPRYIVRNVSFIGNTKYQTEQLSHDLALKQGQYFDQSKMTKDIGTVRDLYGSQGYVFADVQAEPRFLEEPGQLDLVYNLAEGDRYRVGRINVHIEGENVHTRHATVYNRISLHPGDIVDIRQLRASERRLKASGLFQTDPSKGSAPKIVFSPPEIDGASPSVAEKKKSFRGQSPDTQERELDVHWYWPRFAKKPE